MPAQSNSRALTANGLRLIAVFDATKGLLVLLAGFGLLSLLHRDAEVLAEELVGRRLLIHHLWLSGVLLRAAENVTVCGAFTGGAAEDPGVEAGEVRKWNYGASKAGSLGSGL